MNSWKLTLGLALRLPGQEGSTAADVDHEDAVIDGGSLAVAARDIAAEIKLAEIAEGASLRLECRSGISKSHLGEGVPILGPGRKVADAGEGK